MYIQVRLKDVGWTKLYVQTDAKDNTMFLLVDNNLDVSKPYLTLKMKDDSLAIKHQRGEVEDDNDELKRETKWTVPAHNRGEKTRFNIS